MRAARAAFTAALADDETARLHRRLQQLARGPGIRRALEHDPLARDDVHGLVDRPTIFKTIVNSGRLRPLAAALCKLEILCTPVARGQTHERIQHAIHQCELQVAAAVVRDHDDADALRRHHADLGARPVQRPGMVDELAAMVVLG